MILDNMNHGNQGIVKILNTITKAGSTDYSLTDTFEIPAKSFYALTAKIGYDKTQPRGIRICTRENTQHALAFKEQSTLESVSLTATLCGFTEEAMTLYVYTKYSGTSSSSYAVSGFYIPE